jgi:HSP20 family molecular chaperone IbpA
VRDQELDTPQSVAIVDADVLDEMSETDSLIAERAYEIFQARGGEHGSDREDWFQAVKELLPEPEVDYHVSDGQVRISAQAPGFAAKDLEVIIGHRRAVVVGVHPSANGANGASKNKTIMRIVELPFSVDPVLARATLQKGTLQVVLPRLEEDDSSQLSKAAGV